MFHFQSEAGHGDLCCATALIDGMLARVISGTPHGFATANYWLFVSSMVVRKHRELSMDRL